ncbi:MAG: cytochrome c family protein [Pseudomonadota bacterium]
MKKDPLFFNKIAASVLTAGLMALAIGFITPALYQPSSLNEPAYPIGGSAQLATETQSDEPIQLEPILPLLASADLARGEKLARRCVACHSFDAGGANRVGPNLYDIVGKQMAAVDGFAYSSALREAGGSWDYETLSQFINNPKGAFPGTKMNFAGLRKSNDRASIIAWMRTLSDNPAPLP